MLYNIVSPKIQCETKSIENRNKSKPKLVLTRKNEERGKKRSKSIIYFVPKPYKFIIFDWFDLIYVSKCIYVPTIMSGVRHILYLLAIIRIIQINILKKMRVKHDRSKYHFIYKYMTDFGGKKYPYSHFSGMNKICKMDERAEWITTQQSNESKWISITIRAREKQKKKQPIQRRQRKKNEIIFHRRQRRLLTMVYAFGTHTHTHRVPIHSMMMCACVLCAIHKNTNYIVFAIIITLEMLNIWINITCSVRSCWIRVCHSTHWLSERMNSSTPNRRNYVVKL